MEMIWRGSRNYGKDSQIFAGVTYNNYRAPEGFCFDDHCSDPPIQDDPRLFDNNVKERVDLFVKETCEQAQQYKTNNIMLTMGEDFNYQNALKWFKNLDKLIEYVNKVNAIKVVLKINFNTIFMLYICIVPKAEIFSLYMVFTKL